MNCLRLCLVSLVLIPVAEAQTVEWTFDLDAGAAAPTLYPNAESPTGVVISCGTRLIRLGGDGAVVWETQLGEAVASPATVADIDGNGAPEILVAAGQGRVVCLEESATDAGVAVRRRWTHAFDTPSGGFKNVVVADVLPSPGLEALIGFDDGWLNCLSAEGDLLWRFFGDKYRVAPPAVGDVDGDGAPEVVYGTDNGHVYCLGGWGRVEWRYDEFAPYGRSGVNLADLDGDGSVEVLITRSNVGLDRCLMAVDGATGTFKWRSNDVMQGYVSNAIVNFGHEPNGDVAVLHGDKGNWLYATRADGTEKWRVELGGRGIFWAPAAADVDGDGYIEVIVGIRGEDPDSGACVYVVGQDGAIDAAVDLGSGANAGPAVGDIDGDGNLEVVVVTEGPDRVQAVTWNAAGRVEWPSLRGDSAMTAARGVPPGTPAAPPVAAEKAGLAVEDETVYWGQNRWRVGWQEPASDQTFVELSAISDEGFLETWVVDVKPGATGAGIDWNLARPDQNRVRVALHTAANREPLAVQDRSVQPRQPDDWKIGPAAPYRNALEEARAAGADTSGLEARLTLLEAARIRTGMQYRTGAPGAEVADAATRLRRDAQVYDGQLALLAPYWAEGGRGAFVFWQDENPWDPFDPGAAADVLAMDQPVRVTAFGNEFEDAVLTLLNAGPDPVSVRCMFIEPNIGQGWAKPEPPLAKHVTLRRSVAVATAMQDRVFDALPELDRSRSLELPPGEARQLWLVVDTHGLDPGTHELTLYLGSLTKTPTIHAVPIEIEVLPVALPGDVFAKMHWSNFNADTVSDQAVKDMIDHGISSIYGPPLPGVPVDAQGNLAGPVDWTRFDETLDRIPRHFFMLWGGPPSRKWPEGVNPDQESEEYFTGFKTALAQLVEHLEARGIDYDHWAFYPVDEPWNTGFTLVPYLKRFCEMVKRADPNAQNYTDPCGLVRVEYIEEFRDLIDIWQPEMNLLKRDPELVEWFKNNAKHYWAYEAPGPAKDFLPLGHYRAYSWLAWKFGCEGAGYWIYKANDIWWPIVSGDWSSAYQTNDEVVPSRRWEADRDGVEDYLALHVLSQEIDRVRAAGHANDADQARALIDEAVENLVGWNARNIDEITRMTRDHEIEFSLFLAYRDRIAAEILRLRGL